MSSVPARERRALVWVEHGSAPSGPGKTQSTRSTAMMPGAPFEVALLSLALSPDGRRAAFATRAADGGEEYVVRDLETGRDTRVPAPKARRASRPADGSRGRRRAGCCIPAGGVEASQIYDWPADGSAGGRPLVAGTAAQMTSEGAEIIFSRDERSRFRLYRAPIRPDGTAGDAVAVFPAADDPNVPLFRVVAGRDAACLHGRRTGQQPAQHLRHDVAGNARAAADHDRGRRLAAVFDGQPPGVLQERRPRSQLRVLLAANSGSRPSRRRRCQSGHRSS